MPCRYRQARYVWLMEDYLAFSGAIEPMEWGRSVYTVLRIPPEVAAPLHAIGARRVEGEINDFPVNLALTKAPAIDGPFLYTGKSLLRRIGITPGEEVEVRLRKAPADVVETPDDVAFALRTAELSDTWAALTPGKQRGLLHQVTSAKRAETRAKRIVKLLTELSG